MTDLIANREERGGESDSFANGVNAKQLNASY